MKTKSITYKAFLAIFSITLFTSCSKVGIKDPVTYDKAAGNWDIHGVRYRIYANGSSESRDSTVPWKPTPYNYAHFDGKSGLQYCFNSSRGTNGSYKLLGEDSIAITLDGQTTRWKIVLLTSTNFNIETTSYTSRLAPGARVVTYQGFIR